jgi:Tfp pilus assembly protein PilO
VALQIALSRDNMELKESKINTPATAPPASPPASPSQGKPSAPIKADVFAFIKRISAKDKLLILTGAFVILSAITIFCIILPAIKDINYLNKQITSYKSELEQKYRERFNVRQIIDDLEKAKKFLPSIDTSFIPKDSEIDFVESLERIADRYSLRQQLGFNVAPENKNKILKSLDITLTLEGNFSDVLKYLEELEKQDIYVDFKDVLMSQKKDVLNAHFKGTVWELN